MFQQFRSLTYFEVLQHNNDVLSKLNSTGDKYALAQQCQLRVQEVNDEVLHTFVCCSIIESFEWSPDSELIFCSMNKGSTIQVWSIINPTWKWKLDESPLSIIDILWAPDSRSLFMTYEFNIKVKIWSLVSIQTTMIEDVKPIENCVSFSTSYGEGYMVVALRRGCRDYIQVYTLTWMPLKTFPVETKNLSGIFFSPSDLVIAVLEGYTEDLKVMFYSIDGRLLSKFEKSSLFGITSFSWDKSGKLISLGSFNGEVIVLHGSQYKEITSYQHSDTIKMEEIVVYRINEGGSERSSLVIKDTSCDFHINKAEKGRPVSIASVGISEKNKSKLLNCGIQIMEFSCDGQFIASISGDSSNIIYIYNINECRIHSMIIHHQKIKSICWHSKNPLLAISSGCSTLDMWTPSSCISCISPFEDDFSINAIQWSSSQDSLILNSKEKSTVLNFP